MQIKTDRAKFAAIVKPISRVVDEALLNFDDDGMVVRVVDPAHVCMLTMNVPKAHFSGYTVLGREYIAVDLGKLQELVGVTAENATVSLETKDGQLVGSVGGTTRRMKLIPPESLNEPKIPSINVPEKASISLEDVKIALKASRSISDCVYVRTDPPDLVFEATGDADSVIHRIPEVGTKEKVKSLFPIDYLSNFIDAVPSDIEMTIHLGQDYPLSIEFLWGEGAKAVTGHFMLAPRIEND